MDLTILPRSVSEKHSDYVYRVLRQNILDLTLEPGTTLNEQELANCLQVSRTPVREAIFRLKEEHLMMTYPQSSSMVALIDLAYLNAVVYLRVAVETKLLFHLCSGISSAFMDKLQNNLELQQAVCSLNRADGSLFYSLDKAFHHILFDAAGQQILYDLLAGRIAYFDRMSCFLLKYGYQDVQNSYALHREWFRIITAGETGSVVDAVNTHLCKFWSIKPEHFRYFTSAPEDPHLGYPPQTPRRSRRSRTGASGKP